MVSLNQWNFTIRLLLILGMVFSLVFSIRFLLMVGVVFSLVIAEKSEIDFCGGVQNKHSQHAWI